MTAEIETEIAELYDMTTGQLAEKYEQLHGQPTRTRHRQYLIRKNAWRIQANAFGGLSERAKRRAAELANDADIRVMAPKTLVCPPQGSAKETRTRRFIERDPRIPAAGSAIVRAYKGKKLRVLVLDGDQGFEYEGQRYDTLSAVAKHITGSHINGFRFFGLGKKK
ncbi:MAG: DUF2924 domain-containing protein [Phycisphaerales bacterium]